MSGLSLDQAIADLSRSDPTFDAEVRKLLAPVKSRFFAPPSGSPDQPRDGLHTPPPYLTEPDLRKVAVELAELGLDRGIDVNVACEDGSTFLHLCTLLRDPVIAIDAVKWLLAHGADPDRQRDDGNTPLDLAMKFRRFDVAEIMRPYSRRD